jgi:hypothetical protein
MISLVILSEEVGVGISKYFIEVHGIYARIWSECETFVQLSICINCFNTIRLIIVGTFACREMLCYSVLSLNITNVRLTFEVMIHSVADCLLLKFSAASRDFIIAFSSIYNVTTINITIIMFT